MHGAGIQIGAKRLAADQREADFRAVAEERLSGTCLLYTSRERENAEYDAMQSGDINHMPKSERLPWRIYIRDYVDARFNLGEFFIPVAFIILIGSMVVTYKWPALALPLMLIMYVYLFAVIIDVAVMWHKLKKKLIEKFGEQSVAKGMRSGSYAWSRAIQIRRWRLPKPRYPKRGHWPE